MFSCLSNFCIYQNHLLHPKQEKADRSLLMSLGKGLIVKEAPSKI